MAGILFEIFFLKGAFEFVVFILVIFWLLMIYFFKLTEKFSYLGALLLLILITILLVAKNNLVFANSSAEKAALWFYLFLLIGLGQELFRKKPK